MCSMSSGWKTVSPDILKLHSSSCAIWRRDIFLVSFSNHSWSLSGCTCHVKVTKWKSFFSISASTQVWWNQFPTPFGVERAMQRPPVESVGYKPVHSSSKPSTCAASSTTKRERASERPASELVEEAFICEPFVSSKEVLLSIAMLDILIQSGRFLWIALTFLTKFAAVPNFVAMTSTFLSRWNSISHATYAAVIVEMPSCLAFKTTLNRWSLKSCNRLVWKSYVLNGISPFIGWEILA